MAGTGKGRSQVVKDDKGQTRTAPSAEQRQGMRAHDDHGNVRPADGRWDLHRPEDESKVVRTDKGKK